VRPLPAALRPLTERAGDAALFVDFDGTLAPIVDDPALARPLPGVVAVLTRLASQLSLVAVVSGRPVRFLSDALGDPRGVQIVGLYGLESIGPDGSVQTAASAEPWRTVIERIVARAAREAPEGIGVEGKGLSVTLHWRRRPDAASWVQSFAPAVAADAGLHVRQGRMALELLPPVQADKGAVVERLGSVFGAVAYFGDDVGDLPAFAALDRLAGRGAAVARVAVVDAESPSRVRAAADVEVEGPAGALALLESITEHTGAR
jgi:trehalose 6-phosphate phosphatase